VQPQRDLFIGNRTFRFFATGQTISTFGDAFFNIAILWAFYAQTGSAMVAALISVTFHLTDALVSPIAGAYADRWPPNLTMIVSNSLAALVTATFGFALIGDESLGLLPVFLAIIALNTATTFYGSVRFRVIPVILPRDRLTTGNGLVSSVGRVAMMAGMTAAGWVVDALGVAAAVLIDALTFAGTAIMIALAKIPAPAREKPDPTAPQHGILGQLRDGWDAIRAHPVLRELLWIGAALNAVSLIGPLYAPLVETRLDGDGFLFGILNAMGLVGGILAGFAVTRADRVIGTGRLMIGTWVISGACIVGVGLSTSVPLTIVLDLTVDFCMSIGMIANMSYIQATVPIELLGRTSGISRAVGLSAIPLFSLAGAWAADTFSVVPVFIFAGAWLIGVALLAARKPEVRAARIEPGQ